MDVKNFELLDDVHVPYETPNLTITLFPEVDVVRTSDPDAGGEWPISGPNGWGQ